MKGKRRLLPARQRDALIEVLLSKYKTDPRAIESVLPEVAQLLHQWFPASKRAGVFPLTPKEEEERMQSLNKLLTKIKVGKSSLSQEEAIQGLEHVAALREASSMALLEIDRDNVVKLVRIATGLSLSSKGGVRKKVLREGEPSRTVNLFRGVRLNLTWDKKLMSVEVNPEQLKLRKKALDFVGIGKDAPDVALHHDDYLYREPGSV